MKRIPVIKDSVAGEIQKSVTAYWEDRIDENGKKTGEQFKMRSFVFPSMLISMAQLIIGICYGIANKNGIEKPSAKDILSICQMGMGSDFLDHFQLFQSLSRFTETWLDQCAISYDIDDCWFEFSTILKKYNEMCESEKSGVKRST